MEKGKVAHIFNTIVFLALIVFMAFLLIKIHFTILLIFPGVYVIVFIFYLFAFQNCILKNELFKVSFILNVIILLLFVVIYIYDMNREGDLIGLLILLYFYVAQVPLVISSILFLRGYFKNKK